MEDALSLLLSLGAAAFFGGLIGLERELHREWAGLRTHMLVALGSALFVLIGVEMMGPTQADLSRIIQGIAAGIGFIGAGTILKLPDHLAVKGLTTAASIWLVAAVGAACGARLYLLAGVSAVMSVTILHAVRKLEIHLPSGSRHDSLGTMGEPERHSGPTELTSHDTKTEPANEDEKA